MGGTVIAVVVLEGGGEGDEIVDFCVMGRCVSWCQFPLVVSPVDVYQSDVYVSLLTDEGFALTSILLQHVSYFSCV